MKLSEQLKGKIRNISKQKGIHAQEVLQMYMFERFIERLSISNYCENFVLKGGLLISTILGIANRTTMDLDTTVIGLDMEIDAILNVVNEIASIDVGDGIIFKMLDIKPIREDDEYANFRVSMQCEFGKMKIPMKMDITTGDCITPEEIQYEYPYMFESGSILIKAYPIETIISEKFESIIKGNIIQELEIFTILSIN